MEKLSEGEWKLMELLWEDAPVNSTQLVARCREKLQWSKSTTYTVLRRLCHKGAAANEEATVTPLVTREEVLTVLGRLQEAGIENVLALRGDRNPDFPPKEDFLHADELVSFIHRRGDFGVSAACYPEGHPESPDLITDVRYLKQKVDAGAQHLVSQLFFDNDDFFRFLERCRIAGIEVPIEAGIMPVLNRSSIERMVSLCGASMPRKLTRILARYGDHPAALREAGMAYAIDQIADLMAAGVDGIHLYTMNNPAVAKQISESISSIRSV